MLKSIFLALSFSLNLSLAYANVTLPAIFSDHMVLQQNQTVRIWGWAKALEPVKVICSWQRDTLVTTGDPNGNWSVTVSTPSAGGPYSIDVYGYNHVRIDDVWMGEVWLCGGQSNMEWSPRMGIEGREEMLAAGDQPMIRFFKVEHRTAATPQLDLAGRWVVCTPETLIDFSAAGYFFAERLRKNINAPIGLVLSAWGGTPAETWMNGEDLAMDAELDSIARLLQPVPWGPVEPGLAYNAMLYPVTPYRIAGAIWYQGEANTGHPLTYDRLLEALIRSWRSAWGYEFPFYYVQIAPFRYGQEYQGVLLQDAQRKAMRVPRTGMVVINDIGDADDIHPRKKKEVGERLAAWALHDVYGYAEIVCSGPLYSHMAREDNQIRLYFHHAGDRLISHKGDMEDFLIAGENGLFLPARVRIEGNTIIVFHEKIAAPAAVRFAWSNTAAPGVFNPAGLPMSCFRTDDWAIDSF